MIGAAALVADLRGAGILDVLDHVPEVLPDAPCAVLEAPEDYLGAGDTFDRSTFTVRCRLWLFVPLLGNEAATADLDALVLKALSALGEWAIESMAKPGPFTLEGAWLAHGTALTLTNLVTLP